MLKNVKKLEQKGYDTGHGGKEGASERRSWDWREI